MGLRLPLAAAAGLLSACFLDTGGAPIPIPGANYLEPDSFVSTCTEFTQFESVNGVEQPGRWFQVFMWADSSGKVRVGEEVYNRLADAEGYQGILEFSLDPRVPSEADSLEFPSALYVLYHSRYRDLAEVRRSALENVPLNGLIPPDGSSRVGFVAPFRNGALDLDTAWIIINSDKIDTGYGYGMIFRKNGEAALTYRFRKDSAAGDSLLWVIRETRRPCGPVYYVPDGWRERVNPPSPATAIPRPVVSFRNHPLQMNEAWD
ncbi:MAG: hypothetical protein JF616_04590 [Fibrobacteres bacterium]|jgi:hypothetical protein|nr:hypothetical protein [Fibrobacterota bacterium]